MTRAEMMEWLEAKGYILAGPLKFKFLRTLLYNSVKVPSKRCFLSLSSFRIEKRSNGSCVWFPVLGGRIDEYVVGRAGTLIRNPKSQR